MKMATHGREGSNVGGLVKMAGFALTGVLALGGAAFAQPTLDIAVDAPAEYTPSGTVEVTITISRTDSDANPDGDVTALGAEITLPTGWKLERDADANCASTIDDNQTAGVNSTIQVKGSNQTFVDPPANTTCVAIPTTGDVLEIFWIPEGGNDPLPVAFPVVVTATLVAANSTGDQDIDATVKYRVLEGAEQTAAGSDTLAQGQGGGCVTAPGDANGDNSVDPADAQLAFEAFLQIPEALDAITPCGDFCGSGDGVDPADAQGIFNQFLQVGNPCGN